jgi:hypothetical protein
MNDDEFLAAFENADIPRREWSHEAHVRMAFLYLCRLTPSDALDRIRFGIKKLNARNGVVEGYHETITVAFVRLIAARLSEEVTFPKFRERNPDLFDRTLTALLIHYTRDRLFSPEARRDFLEPDLQPLPTVGSGFDHRHMNSSCAN